MGLFNNLFKSVIKEENNLKINWVALSDKAQLSAIIKISLDKPVLIFKHSTRCIISKSVLKSFEKEFDMAETEIDMYFLDLLNYRALSQDVSTTFKVVHQSPQVLVIKNEKVIYNESHSYISFDKIKEILKS